MTTHNRKIKIIEFRLAAIAFECQVSTWTMNNATGDGDKLYAQCAAGEDGEFRDEAEPDYTLDITFFSDWRANGISRYLTQNDGELAAFKLDHHPDIPLEHVYWAGTCKLRAPNAGGDARTTEMTEVSLPIIGKPVFTAADES